VFSTKKIEGLLSDECRAKSEAPLHGFEVVLPPPHFGIVDFSLRHVRLFHFHSSVVTALPNLDNDVGKMSGRPTLESPLLNDLGEGDDFDENAADVAVDHLEGLALLGFLHLDFAGGEDLEHLSLRQRVEKFLT